MSETAHLAMTATSAERPATNPSWIACLVILVGIRVCLRVAGLGRSLRLVRRCALRPAATHESSPIDAQSVARRIAAVAAFLPARVLCLEQSMALYLVLRRAGADVALRLGVQPYPFLAHAWVELAGQPIAETHDKVAMFLPIAGLED